MLRAFGHPIAICCDNWVLLAQVLPFSNLTQQHTTCRYTSQPGQGEGGGRLGLRYRPTDLFRKTAVATVHYTLLKTEIHDYLVIFLQHTKVFFARRTQKVLKDSLQYFYINAVFLNI